MKDEDLAKIDIYSPINIGLPNIKDIKCTRDLKMNNCKGLLGKIFGHKLESFIVYKGHPKNNIKVENADEDELLRILEASRELKYEIICKRCGYNFCSEI